MPRKRITKKLRFGMPPPQKEEKQEEDHVNSSPQDCLQPVRNSTVSATANTVTHSEQGHCSNSPSHASNICNQDSQAVNVTGFLPNDGEDATVAVDVEADSCPEGAIGGLGISENGVHEGSLKNEESVHTGSHYQQLCNHHHQLPVNHNQQQQHNGNVQPPNFNWQANKATVKDRISFLFNNEILADVHFVVGREPQVRRIPAHKFVLSIGSAVFDAMFNGAMSLKQDDVDLPDVEPEAFLALLKFLYTDDVTIGPETVMTTLYTAKKYAVPALEKECVDFLKGNLSSDNAFMLLTQARLFDEPQLAALCLETIDKNTCDALIAEGFTEIDLDTLIAVLERDTLRIRENKLFAAVARWSEAECMHQHLPVIPENQRSILGRALYLIRFPLMTIEEFATGPAQSGILTDREVVSLFLHYTVNPKPSVNFLNVPRCCMTGKENTVCRFQRIESRWGYSGTSDRIRFMVDKKVFIVGFGLYGSIHGPTDYQVNIQVLHTGSGKALGSNDTSFSCDGSNSTFRIIFKEPIEVVPNTNYTACATLRGPDSYYGTKGLRKVSHESLKSGRVTFHFTYAAGNNNGTSVEDGQIPEIIFYT